MTSDRIQQLHAWIQGPCGFQTYDLQTMPHDASFRRYFRVIHPTGSYVAMDAPPERETTTAFIAIANALRLQGLQAPKIFQSEVQLGFLLMSDFGDLTLLKALNINTAEGLYATAMDALAQLQRCQVADWSLPEFTSQFMFNECLLFQDWFLQQFLGMDLCPKTEAALKKIYGSLSGQAHAQPQVFMHRDYHAANLMVLPSNEIGILDFQDAFRGPLLYDLVSLLRDCYIDWPDHQVKQWALSYRDRIESLVPPDLFLQWFDGIGLQRHLKALLTFSRKYCRDQDPSYLKFVPRTLNYIIDVSARYSEWHFLCDFFKTRALPAYEKKALSCVP